MSSSESVVGSARLGYGAVAGGLAFILNYLIAFVLWSATSFPDTFEGALRELVTGQVPDWVFAGWLLYGAHFVDITTTVSLGPASPEVTTNAVSAVGQSTTDILFVTVPAILVVAGVALARSHGAQSTSDGLITGAAAALGYFPLVAIGVFVYPTVFGALGGLLATVVD